MASPQKQVITDKQDEMKNKSNPEKPLKKQEVNIGPTKQEIQTLKRAKIQAQRQLTALKKMKNLEIFFDKKYLGNKNKSKTMDFKRLTKMPSLNPQSPEDFINLKTNNLNYKVKEIQSIFKTQKKGKNKKKFVDFVELTDFDLYLTKRDILKEKNLCIDEIRKQYIEQKKKQLQKQQRKRKKIQTLEDYVHKAIKQENSSQQKHEISKNVNDSQQKAEGHQLSRTTPNQTQKPQQTQSNILPAQLSKKKRENPKASEVINDNYFQKQFEQNIIRKKFKQQNSLSIKTLLDPNSRRRTTLNQNQFIRNELNAMQNIARSTLVNFQTKQKINKMLYGHNIERGDSEYNLNSNRSSTQTPSILNGQSVIQKTERKQIDWILNECDNFKKNFKIRKSKSHQMFKKAY